MSMMDWCDRSGASQLAARIEDFWRKRGFEVSVETEEAAFVSTMRSARMDVRSDMVNGMPTKNRPLGST